MPERLEADTKKWIEKRKKGTTNKLNRRAWDKYKQVSHDVKSEYVKTGKFKSFVYKIAKSGMELDKVAKPIALIPIPFIRTISWALLGIDGVCSIVVGFMKKGMEKNND